MPQPGLEPGPSNPESSTLTTGLLTPDVVKSTGIIPAIRADHDATTLDIEELETELKGSGYWKMNCSLLVDKEYVNSVTEMIPIWTAEGRKVLSDDRST